MKATTQRRLRQFHNWTGMFFAPAIFFFAFTGLLQVTGLQDRQAGYQPPAWIAATANLHKHQTISRPRRPDGPRPPAARPAPEHREGGQKFIALKPFALLTAIALMAITGLGVAVGLANRATRRTGLILLALGTAIPVLLMLV